MLSVVLKNEKWVADYNITHGIGSSFFEQKTREFVMGDERNKGETYG